MIVGENMETLKITTEYITLGQFLKIENIISSGGEAKFYLSENEVLVDGTKETRRGRKLYPGMVIKIKKEEYKIL